MPIHIHRDSTKSGVERRSRARDNGLSKIASLTTGAVLGAIGAIVGLSIYVAQTFPGHGSPTVTNRNVASNNAPTANSGLSSNTGVASNSGNSGTPLSPSGNSAGVTNQAPQVVSGSTMP